MTYMAIWLSFRAPYPIASASYGATVQTVQMISFVSIPSGGFFRLGLFGSYSFNIAFNASALDLQSTLSTVSTIGMVSVVTTSATSWEITFLQRLGPIPPLDAISFLSPPNTVLVTIITAGTSSAISGTYILTFNGSSTSTLNVNDGASTVQTALQQIPNLSTLQVVRHDSLNNGAMFLLYFPVELGDVSPIGLISSLSGTALDIAIVTQQNGEGISGYFFIYSYDSSGNRVSTDSLSPSISASLLATQIEGLNSSYGGLVVSRSPGESYGTFIWSITWPIALGPIDILNAYGANLNGDQVSASFTRVQKGAEPYVLKISTVGSSALSGRFTLTVDGITSDFVAFNASATDVKEALETLSSVGAVEVTRIDTGFVDHSTWNPSTKSVHLEISYPLFQTNLNTYVWLVTFLSRAGPAPVVTPCCGELTTMDPTAVTLKSEWTQDSNILIETVQRGPTSSLSGSVAIAVDGVYTDFFPLNASAATVTDLLYNIGLVSVIVSRSAADPNGHFNWYITFLNATVPYVDAFTSPMLAVASYKLFPAGSRDRATFEWDTAPVIPSHCFQEVVLTGLSVSCTLVDFIGNTAVVSFLSSDSLSTINSAFNTVSAIFGNTTVVFTSITGTLWVIFDSYAHYLPPMACSNANVQILQNSTLSPLGGDFVLSSDPITEALNESIRVPFNVSSSALAAALNSILGNNSVVVTQVNSVYGYFSWNITFTGSIYRGDVGLLACASTLLVGTDAFCTFSEVIPGSSPSGYVQLLSGSNSSVSIPVLSSALDLEYIFADFLSLSSVSVQVLGPQLTFDGSIIWWLLYFPENAYTYLAAVNGTQVQGPGAQTILSTFQVGTLPLGGSVVLGVDNSSSFVSIQLDSSADTVEHALLPLLGNETIYAVTTSRDSNSVEWIISFDFGAPLVNVSVNISTVLGSNVLASVSSNVSAFVQLGGSFTLAANGLSSPPISVNASAIDVAQALQSIGINDAISVSASNYSFSQSQWMVTFDSLSYAGRNHLPIMTTNSSVLTGGNAAVSTSLLSPGASSSIYEVTVPFLSGGNLTVELLWDGLFMSLLDTSAGLNVSQLSLSNSGVIYAYYEKSFINGTAVYLILIVPTNFSSIHEASRFTALVNGSVLNSTSLYSGSTLDFQGLGSLQFSLGNEGCAVLIGGIYCSPASPLEASTPVGLPPSSADVADSLMNLRDIVLVDTSCYTLS